MKGVDRVTVVSPEEASHYPRVLGMQQTQIVFSPIGWHDLFAEVSPSEGTAAYICAAGRSYRDYATFFAAMSDLDARAVVICKRFNLRGLTYPKNVTVYDYMSMPEFAHAVARSLFVVLPLQDVPFAVGAIHVVQTMAAGKAIVATRTCGISYYVEDGVTGLLVRPDDAADMRKACQYLLDHPNVAEEMGRRGRKRYEAEFTADIAARRHYELMRTMTAEPRVIDLDRTAVTLGFPR